MKHLSCGCSYTDNNYIKYLLLESDITQPVMWPELFSKKINAKKTINVAESSMSHYEIFQKCFSNCIEHNPSIITIGLTEWSRHYIPGFGTFNPVFQFDIANFIKNKNTTDEFENTNYDSLFNRFQKLEENKLEEFALISKKLLTNVNFIETVVNDLHQKLFLLIEYCKLNNVNLLVAQLVDPFPLWFTEKNILNILEKYTIQSPYFNYLNLNKEKLIGWPFLPSLDGWNYDFARESNDKDKITWTHRFDRHPNQIGQHQIADIFFNEYINVYKN